MTKIDIFTEEWNREATDMEAALGGIRIGSLKPPGTSATDDTSELYDEKTLQQEEIMLRKKLALQLKQMRDREVGDREYPRIHGITPKLDIPESSGVYATF